jgi:hypothetical protein
LGFWHRASLDLVEIGAGLVGIEIGQEPHAGAVSDGVEQQIDQALAIMRKAFSVDTT